MLTPCYHEEESASIGRMPSAEEVEKGKLREVFRRWMLERQGDWSDAEFARQTGITKAEISTVKSRDRQPTEGQIVKVCSSVGPQLSEALSRMALIARDVEAEIEKNGHVTIGEADEESATLVTASGKKVTMRPEAVAAAARRIESEAKAPPTTEGRKKRAVQRRSRHGSARPQPPRATPPRHPSQGS